MTYIQRRQFKYFGRILLVVILAGVSTVWFTRFFQNQIQTHLDELQTLNELEFHAVQTQYLFKKQIQEWKNVLLRGHSPADFERYFSLFMQEYDATQNSINKLNQLMLRESHGEPQVSAFIIKHQALLNIYLHALEEFKDSNFDTKKIDLLVRGADREPTELLDNLVAVLSTEIDEKRYRANQQLTNYVILYGASFVFLQAFFCLLVVRLTGVLLKASVTDKTTQLGNRELFVNSVADAINQQQQATIALIDINNFKLINEAFGNSGGDKYLHKVAKKIKHSLTSNESICRIGGDLLGVILLDSSTEKATLRIEHIKQTIAQFKFIKDGISLSCTASAGVVCMHHSNESSSEQVLNNLYASLQEAKSQGPGTTVVFSKDQQSVQDRRSQMKTVAEINHALEESRIVLFRQRVFDLSSTQNAGYYEILMRIKQNQKYEPPGLFIAAAERFHMMSVIDRYILKQVVEYQVQSHRHSPYYAINLSGATLSDPTFIDFVHEIFTTQGLVHAKLGFEITETDVVRNFTVASNIIRTLKSYGCRIALDDFGTGMSSYAYMTELDVDTIKIDGTFIRNIDKKPSNQSIIKSIVSLAKELKILTVAEFVETNEELNVLKTLGVDYAQGYYLARPELAYDPTTNDD